MLCASQPYFYEIFEERLASIQRSFEWKKFLFFVTFATHIWRLKRSLECYHFSGRQLSYKCFGHTSSQLQLLLFFVQLRHKGRISEKVRGGEQYNCRIVVIVVPAAISKRKNFQAFFECPAQWAFKFLVHFSFLSLIKNDNFCEFLPQKRPEKIGNCKKRDAFNPLKFRIITESCPHIYAREQKIELTTNVLFVVFTSFWVTVVMEAESCHYVSQTMLLCLLNYAL